MASNRYYYYETLTLLLFIMALFILAGGSASVISLFITAPSLVGCTYWIIKKIRSRRQALIPDDNLANRNPNLNTNNSIAINSQRRSRTPISSQRKSTISTFRIL